jgi:predicted TIM-barrel fold metal-dependent hydrolase
VKKGSTIDWGCQSCFGTATRRQFLAGLGVLGAGVLLPNDRLWGQTETEGSARPYRIDVHHHFSPPTFAAEVTARNGAGHAILSKWTPQRSLDEMDKSGVATSMLSITRPGIWYGDLPLVRKLARECNEFGAKMVADHPGRFGLFAVLPLPDVDASLREMEYAFDTLKADGIGVLSSYDNKYLGDPAFAPVMDELNRRKGILYEHPVHEDLENFLNEVELITDTTRTIASLLYSGTVLRCPDIRFIFAHGGGTLSSAFVRMGALAEKYPKGLIPELQKFYYDTAGVYASPAFFPSFKAIVPLPHILYGSDYPMSRGEAAAAKGLKDNGGFTASEMHAIERDNALALFPRFNT